MNKKEKDLIENIIRAGELTAEIEDQSEREAKESIYANFLSSLRLFFLLLEEDNVDHEKINAAFIRANVLNILIEKAVGTESLINIEISQMKDLLLEKDVEDVL